MITKGPAAGGSSTSRSCTSTATLVPDLAGWRREPLPQMPKGVAFTVEPDWVCEVLSPGTRGVDVTTKRDVYAGHFKKPPAQSRRPQIRCSVAGSNRQAWAMSAIRRMVSPGAVVRRGLTRAIAVRPPSST